MLPWKCGFTQNLQIVPIDILPEPQMEHPFCSDNIRNLTELINDCGKSVMIRVFDMIYRCFALLPSAVQCNHFVKMCAMLESPMVEIMPIADVLQESTCCVSLVPIWCHCSRCYNSQIIWWVLPWGLSFARTFQYSMFQEKKSRMMKCNHLMEQALNDI